MWMLLDDEGSPIRYFDYPHEGAIEIVEKKLTFKELMEQLGEALF
jgi:hypothetical protein